jgi:hypothetical protein
MPSTYTLIKGETLASSAASYTFTAIPSTFTDLVIRASVLTTRAAAGTDYLFMQFNSTTSGYSGTQLYGTGGASASTRDTASTFIIGPEINTTGLSSTVFTNLESYIPSYTSSTNKQISIDSAEELNSSTAYRYVQANLAPVTAAVTSILLRPSTYYSASWAAGTSFYLYGVKNA